MLLKKSRKLKQETSKELPDNRSSDPVQLFQGNSVKISLHAKPGAKEDKVVGFREGDGVIEVQISSPATNNQANSSLLVFIASILDVRKHQVSLLAGAKSRDKIVRVEGVSVEEVMSRIRKSVKN